ncbi:MAG: type II toxin-antitoxin system VapC family toxin [Candidatus Omnitrophica bacterium]|nr:type II toxin-antitoxin system VapC family toxin [Candidatus Omnitrophota bacterium]
MIVVDTNVLVYFFLRTEFTDPVDTLFKKDPEWIAPLLWRSEFRNVLALYIRKDLIDLQKAIEIQEEAESLLAGNEYEVPSQVVLSLARETGCSAYDCEFLALAKQQGIKLVTADRKLIEAAPEVAVSVEGIGGD